LYSELQETYGNSAFIIAQDNLTVEGKVFLKLIQISLRPMEFMTTDVISKELRTVSLYSGCSGKTDLRRVGSYNRDMTKKKGKT
jgi:hypothetical protein